ncbi:MAG: YCF48-related protein [Bacteroidota bacterium]
MRILAILIFLSCISTAQAQTLGSWKRISHRTEFTLWDVTCTDSLRCYIVGDYGVIMYSTDGGESWTQKLSPNQRALRNIHFFNDSTGLISGFNGSCYRTKDRGNSWTECPVNVPTNFAGLSAVGNTVWLCGTGGVIVKSTDQGATWQTLNSGTDVAIDAISFADASNGWATSVQRKVLHTRDGGASWQEQKVEEFLPITTVCARSANECWVAGYHGLLMRTIDGGQSWQQIEAYETDFFSLKFDANGTGWAVGKRGAIVRGEDSNLRWRLHDLTTAKELHAISFLPNNQALTVGLFGMVFKQPLLYPPPPAAPTKSTETP